MSIQSKPQAEFIIVWSFNAHPEKREKFEEAYGPDGIWAQFFRQGKGYIRTELRAVTTGRYLTLDYWQSRAEFEDFKRSHTDEYQAIDQQCEALTEEEEFVGQCETAEQIQQLLVQHGLPPWPAADVRIRAATADDVAVIMALERSAPTASHWTEEAYKQILAGGAAARITLVVETHAGVLLGFVVARLAGDECEIENIVIDEENQRGGIGGKLLQALIESARAQGTERILLEVRESNIAARRLYETRGFTLSGRRRSYYADPLEDALVYQSKL